MKRKMIKGTNLLASKKNDDSILDLIAESELEEIASTEVKVVTLKERQQNVLSKLRENRKNVFGIRTGGNSGDLLSALKGAGGGTKVAPNVQIEELRKAQKTIVEAQSQGGSHVDFNWGDNENEDDEQMRRKLATVTNNEDQVTDLKSVQSDLDTRAEKLRNALEVKRLEDGKTGTIRVAPYRSDKKSIEQAKTSLEQAIAGGNLKTLDTEIEKVKASGPAVSKALEKEVKS